MSWRIQKPLHSVYRPALMPDLPVAFSALIPLIGVFLGWALRELSQFFSARREEKVELKKAIFVLRDLAFMLRQQLPSLEAFDEIEDSPLHLYRLLEGALSDEHLDSDAFEDKLRGVLNTVAGIDPFLAQNFRVFASGFRTSQIESFRAPGRANVRETNARVVESQTAGLLDRTLKMERAVAWRHGYLLWARVRLHQRRDEADERQGPFADIIRELGTTDRGNGAGEDRAALEDLPDENE